MAGMLVSLSGLDVLCVSARYDMGLALHLHVDGIPITVTRYDISSVFTLLLNDMGFNYAYTAGGILS